MSSEVPIPEAAVEKAAVRMAGRFRGDEGQWRGYWDAAELAVCAAAPLIKAAHAQALLDEAFPDGEDSDYHYGCERLLDLVRESASVLRGEGQTNG